MKSFKYPLKRYDNYILMIEIIFTIREKDEIYSETRRITGVRLK